MRAGTPSLPLTTINRELAGVAGLPPSKAAVYQMHREGRSAAEIAAIKRIKVRIQHHLYVEPPTWKHVRADVGADKNYFMSA